MPGEPAGEAILLRVMGSAPLPVEDRLIGLKIADLKNRAVKAIGQEMDNLTKSEIQFGGIACRILGTFYNQNGTLRLGADIESYLNAAELRVYCPGPPRWKPSSIISAPSAPLRRRRRRGGWDSRARCPAFPLAPFVFFHGPAPSGRRRQPRDF